MSASWRTARSTSRPREREAFPLAVARALGPAPVALELAAPLVAVGGAVLLWRGDAVDARRGGRRGPARPSCWACAPEPPAGRAPLPGRPAPPAVLREGPPRRRRATRAAPAGPRPVRSGREPPVIYAVANQKGGVGQDDDGRQPGGLPRRGGCARPAGGRRPAGERVGRPGDLRPRPPDHRRRPARRRCPSRTRSCATAVPNLDLVPVVVRPGRAPRSSCPSRRRRERLLGGRPGAGARRATATSSSTARPRSTC